MGWSVPFVPDSPPSAPAAVGAQRSIGLRHCLDTGQAPHAMATRSNPHKSSNAIPASLDLSEQVEQLLGCR